MLDLGQKPFFAIFCFLRKKWPEFFCIMQKMKNAKNVQLYLSLSLSSFGMEVWWWTRSSLGISYLKLFGEIQSREMLHCCCWSYTDADGHVDLKFEIKFVFWVAFNLKKKQLATLSGRDLYADKDWKEILRRHQLMTFK